MFGTRLICSRCSAICSDGTTPRSQCRSTGGRTHGRRRKTRPKNQAKRCCGRRITCRCRCPVKLCRVTRCIRHLFRRRVVSRAEMCCVDILPSIRMPVPRMVNGQVQNTFNSDPTVGQKLNILKQGQSSVINGNLLTIPVGGGLLYVQPVYVKSTGSTSYPLLQKVLVAFGDRIAFEDTLNTALDVLFGGDSGASAGDSTTASPSTTLPAPPSVPGAAQDSPAPGAASVTTQSLLQQASVQLKAKQAALAAGDWAAYGAADTKLTEVINQLVALNPAPAVATPTPSPSAGTQ